METLSELKIKFDGYSYDQLLHVIASQAGDLAVLRAMMFDRRSEKYPVHVGQGSLFDEAEEIAKMDPEAAIDDDTIEVKGHKKKRGKRQPLPADLPRERVEHDLSDVEKICPVHNEPMIRIGEKISEELEIVPAKLKVIEHVSFSYKCQCCSDQNVGEKIVTSKPEPRLIPGSIASANLVAFIAVSKYQDGLPLYRQESAFKRIGIDLNRTSMARWMIQASEQAVPILNLMRDKQLESKVVGCDETPVQVLDEPNRTPEQKSYMWVTRSFEGQPIILFDYYPSRSAKVVAEIFSDYEGVVVCDGLKSYDAFAQCSKLTLSGCLAHVRRKFYQAEKAAKKANPKGQSKATEARKIIKELYKIEDDLKGQSPDKVLEERSKRSAPIMDRFKSWLDSNKDQALPKSLMGKAVNYALGQWEKLQVFLKNPYVGLDNNLTEGSIRPFVIGRNAWMFSQSQDGAHASARLYSLIESAKANGIDPFSYLSLIFKELPKAKSLDDYERLLPHTISQHYLLQPYQRPN